jgi:hypothetical protein
LILTLVVLPAIYTVWRQRQVRLGRFGVAGAMQGAT